MKNTIFISHAQPEDNYFCTWLASKLRLLGFNIWLELDDLESGSTFNSKIENIIRNDVVLCLVVVSNSYINKYKIPYSGVVSEANLMTQLARGQNDFIIPLQVEDFPSQLLPMIFSGIDKINFIDNWGLGLEKLIKFLNKKEFKKVEIQNNILEDWYKSIKHKSNKVEREERYYSNWFPISFPAKIFVYKPNVLEWKEVYKIPYTFIRVKDRIIGFFTPEECNKYIKTYNSDIFDVNIFISNIELNISDSEDYLKFPQRIFINLINRICKNYLISRGLYRYELSSKRDAFYYLKLPNESNRVSLKKYKKTSRTLTGISNEYCWHFAISNYVFLTPFPYLLISHHLYFTMQTGEIISDSKLLHTLRRSVPVDWYNRKWFETLLAMSVRISDNKDSWEIVVGDNAIVEVSTLPYNVFSNIGYIEPQNVE